MTGVRTPPPDTSQTDVCPTRATVSNRLPVSAHTPPPAVPVLVVGPPPDQIGGMSTVVGQMLAMDFDRRYRIAFLPFTRRVDQRESLLNRVVRHVVQGGTLRSTIRESGTSIVHFHTCSGFSFYRTAADALMARRLGCRTVVHVHGGGFDAFHAHEPPWRRKIVASMLAVADRVVAVSAGWHDKLRRIAPLARVVAIENAVEIPPGVRPACPDDTCRFLFLASMDQGKGVDDLLSACRELHEEGIAFEVVLAGPPGTAGDAAIIGEKICNFKGAVRYVGAVRGKEKEKLLSRADVYVQPSHCEGMPIAMLEALACGLPVIATDVGAVPEVIENGRQGVIVNPGCPRELARAMRELAADPQRRAAMSCTARALAERRFSTCRLRDDLMGLYDGLMR